jgi:hypothetical protein
MWYKTAIEEIGSDKNLDLQISIAPHTKDPEEAVKQLRKALVGTTGK